MNLYLQFLRYSVDLDGYGNISFDGTFDAERLKSAGRLASQVLQVKQLELTAGEGYVANPHGAQCVVERVILYVREGDAGKTIRVGVGETPTEDVDNLIDDLSLASVGLFSNLDSPGTNGKAAALWEADEYIVFNASAVTTAEITAFVYYHTTGV